MGIEQEIANKLASGLEPLQLMQSGYNKATIYKVQRALRAKQGQVDPPNWHVDWHTNKPDNRFLPGESMILDWAFRNLSGVDMYVYLAGVQPEWMQGQWCYGDVRDLLKPGQAKALRLQIPIPSDCAFGEQDIRFGLQAQFLLPNSINVNPPNQIQWSDPGIIELKYPSWGTMFISHSMKDVAMIRVLQNYLDIYGLRSIIAEDISEPSRYLPEKFAEKIHQSDFFMALLTWDAVVSEWVQQEIRYAIQIGKPPILLREEGVNLPPDINLYEWQPFSRSEDVGSLATKIVNASQYVTSLARNFFNAKVELPVGTIIAGGILAFLAGIAMGMAAKSQSKSEIIRR